MQNGPWKRGWEVVGQCKGQEVELSLFIQGMAGCWLEHVGGEISGTVGDQLRQVKYVRLRS